MKHFDIEYTVGSHRFTYKCTTIFEAAQALYDIGVHDPKAFDISKIDDFIYTLMRLKDGHVLSSIGHYVAISYEDGEV